MEPDNIAILYELLEMACEFDQPINAQNGDVKPLRYILYKMKKAIAAEEEHLREIEQAQEEHRVRSEIKRAQEEEGRRLLQEKHDRHVAKVTCTDLPLDWENAFLQNGQTEGIKADNCADGLILCLQQRGEVDIEYISAITDCSYGEVISQLEGAIFQNPSTWNECFYKGWELSDEYLSGNLAKKREEAVEANDYYNGYFSKNIEAIDEVLPKSLCEDDIYVALGSPWIPTDVIAEFGKWILDPEGFNDIEVNVKHDKVTGTWQIEKRGAAWYVPDPETGGKKEINKTFNRFACKAAPALQVLEMTLNNKRFTEPASTTRKTSKQSQAHQYAVDALEKQTALEQAFQKWVWSDKRRAEQLVTIYNNTFGCVRRRVFDGSFLTFPGMSKDISLYPHQRNAVARILLTPNTLLAHNVGTGKTFIMIAAAMEAKRLGISKKNLIVVPNSILEQWRGDFSRLYPDSNVFCVTPDIFTPSRREKTLETIRDGDFDAIIIPYSCFEQIELSKKAQCRLLEDQISEAEEVLRAADQSTNSLKRKTTKLRLSLRELQKNLNEGQRPIAFDDLGITRLFIDEAHNFKNIPISTKAAPLAGLNFSGSDKCKNIFEKIRLMQAQNNGGGLVLATGTPIANSVSDAFVMQQFLQRGALRMAEIGSFDSWIGMFAEIRADLEIDVDTTNYRSVTRLSRFHNLRELTTLLSMCVDFYLGKPNDQGNMEVSRKEIIVPKTPAFNTFLKTISKRADKVRMGRQGGKADNMLLITSDGRRAALDLRLVRPGTRFCKESKVAYCAEKVAEIYHQTKEAKSTQLVFCDISTPKKGFNLYDELKRLLVEAAVDPQEVAYVHDATTGAQREELFAKVRSGEIRVLLGSTAKLGTGVNVQDRLFAIHHLDVPWRPADMAQREGRIIRQGNMNTAVEIYRYITEGSFDSYSWQLLEIKQNFINELLEGSLDQRDFTDISETALDYAEVKAIAVGDPRIKERVELCNKLARLSAMQRKEHDEINELKVELHRIPKTIQRQDEGIEACQKDLGFYEDWLRSHPDADANKDTDYQAHIKKLDDQLVSDLSAHIFKPFEKTLFEYRGFNVIAPAGMSQRKPFVYLQREGRYKVSLSPQPKNPSLPITRITNKLGRLGSELKKRTDAKRSTISRRNQINERIAESVSYVEEIERTERIIWNLDREMGLH